MPLDFQPKIQCEESVGIPVLTGNGLSTDLEILDRAAGAMKSGLVSQALDEIIETFFHARQRMPAEEWAEFGRFFREHHPLLQILNQDPMTMRALEKPRGYAGDA